MTDDICPAALRLLCSLPVRTHAAKLPERRLAPQQIPGHSRKRSFVRSGIAKPIRISGVTYPSVTAAARRKRRALKTIYKWLASGIAEYIHAKK